MHQTAEQLQTRLHAGEWKQGQRLPSEQSLCAALGVSRITLRDALRVLEDRGLIERRHGLGSYVTMNSGHLTAGLEQLESYTRTMARHGYKAEDRVIAIEGGSIPPEIARGLDVPPGSLGWTILSLRLANGVPVFYCQDILSTVLVPDRRTLEGRHHKQLLEFVREDVGATTRYAFLTIGATVAGPEMVSHLECELGEALVVLKGIAFDETDRPLYHHTAYVRSKHIDLTLVRR